MAHLTTTLPGENPSPASRADYDPITFSVILARFKAIVNEMTLTLERSAWTQILALARDFSCAVYDSAARQIAMYEGLPIHTTSMQLVVAKIGEVFGTDIRAGDVYLCNDPYSGNTHIGDLVSAAPVFYNDRLVFWSVTKGHQLDTGAFVPSSVTASSQNIWQEGLQIPPIKLVDAGVTRSDVLGLYLANMRYSDLLEGDLLAQLGSIEKGRQRLVELCEEYGDVEVTRYVDAIVDYADRRMSDELSAMPDGEYRAEGWIDSDGYTVEHIPIRVKVTIRGDHVDVDFEGSGPQAEGGANGCVGSSMAAGTIPFLYYIDPDIPHNHGCIAHVTVRAPEGTICNAAYPASTSCATIVPSDMMQDAINKALVEAMPERVPAGSTRAANIPMFAGDRDDSGNAWGCMLFNNSGGQGAAMGVDGWPLLESQAALGGVKIQSIEQLELLFPLHIEQNEIEPDSMGAGQWIGGPGTRFVVRPRTADMVCITFGDGCANPPHGALGGTPGIGGGQYVEELDSGKRTFVSASGNIHVRAGTDVWVGVSTGGGGFGHPCDRDVEQVRRDVRDGVISRNAARDLFGVVVSDDLDPVVDADATMETRNELRQHRRPVVEPTVPNAATWLRDEMRQGDVYLLNPTL